MTLYPKPITPPRSVDSARKKRYADVVLAAGVGIVIRLCIIVFEFVGYRLFDSSALLLDALSSLFDVGASIILVICIKFAAKPPDWNHPFGHGRIEPLIGLQLGLFLAGLGCYMLYQQLVFAYQADETPISAYAWAFPFLAVVLLECTYQFIKRRAKKYDSPALAADAIHYRVDSFTSLVAMVVLGLGVFYPDLSHSFDHFGAVAIAGVMVVLGLNAAKGNLNQLLDRTPSETYFSLVQQAAESIEGVLGTEKIRIQQYGPDAHVDIDIEVAPNDSVESAHQISQKVRAEIQRRWPAVRDVTVHIEPYYPNDH